MAIMRKITMKTNHGATGTPTVYLDPDKEIKLATGVTKLASAVAAGDVICPNNLFGWLEVVDNVEEDI